MTFTTSSSLAARRARESPTFWLTVLAGSFVLHLLSLVLIRLYLARTVKVEVTTPIQIEFVQPRSAQSRSTSVARSTQSRSTSVARSPTPVRAGQTQAPAAPAASSPPADSGSSVPAAPVPAVPRSPTPPNPVPPPRSRRNETTPPESPGSTPQPTQPPTQPPPPSQPPPNPPTQPPVSPPPSPPTSPTDGNSGPVESGQPLPPPVRGAEVTERNGSVEVLETRQGVDVKVQAAQPIAASKTVASVRYFGPGEELYLQVELVISENGQYEDVKSATLLSQSQSLAGQPGTDGGSLRSLTRQVFQDWGFEPAQDGRPPEVPLRPVRSTLIVEVRIRFS